MKHLFIFTAGLTLALSGAAFAQPSGGGQGSGKKGPEGKGGPVGMMDTDKDGSISRAEWDAFHAEMFQKIDTNGDGLLSADEFKAAHKKMKQMHKMKKMKKQNQATPDDEPEAGN
jgi:hypothetical protein